MHSVGWLCTVWDGCAQSGMDMHSLGWMCMVWDDGVLGAQPSPGLHTPKLRPHSPSPQSCWNCGRKASETCSGCNTARYCGSFCQHKDWERHHRICGQSLHGQSKPLALPTGRVAAAAAAKGLDGIPSPALEKTSATTSRSSTPASVTAIDTNGL